MIDTKCPESSSVTVPDIAISLAVIKHIGDQPDGTFGTTTHSACIWLEKFSEVYQKKNSYNSSQGAY